MKKLGIFLVALLLMSSIVFADPTPTIVGTACTSNSQCPSGQTCQACPSGATCTSARICLAAAGTAPAAPEVAPDLDFLEGATLVVLCDGYGHIGTGVSGRGPTAPRAPKKATLTLRNRDAYEFEYTRDFSGNDRITLKITKKAGTAPAFGPYSLTLESDTGTTSFGPAGQEINIRRSGEVAVNDYIRDQPGGLVYLMRGGCAELYVGQKSEIPASSAGTVVVAQERPTASLSAGTSLQAALPSVSMGAALPPKTKFQAKQPELKPLERVTDKDVSSSKFRFSEYTCRDGTLNFDAGNGCAPLGEWYAKAKRFCGEHKNLQDFKVFNASACVPGGLGVTAGTRAEGTQGTNLPATGVNVVQNDISAPAPLQKSGLFRRILGRWWSVA